MEWLTGLPAGRLLTSGRPRGGDHYSLRHRSGAQYAYGGRDHGAGQDQPATGVAANRGFTASTGP